jgi:hypothetical protein
MRKSPFVRILEFALIAVFFCAGCAGPPRMPPISPRSSQTCPGLGRAQGVTFFHDKVFLYGDAETGVLREYQLDLEPTIHLTETGQSARLTRGGANLLNHPTGLALHDGLPCFLGNTVTATKQGKIYRLDLDRALADGTLDHAVLNETLDDLAVQGCRPEYVRVDGRFFLATSDYGPGPNFVRFYDPKALATASKTSDPGVLVRRVPCGPWVQMLHWIDRTHTLVIVQNIVEGRRWRLTLVTDLHAGDYRAGQHVQVIDIPDHYDELEGYSTITAKLGLFITSSRQNNVTFAAN